MKIINKENVPCVSCIDLPMCKNTRVESNIGPVLTKLGTKCDVFKSYMTLEDLNFTFPPIGLSMEEKSYFNVPQAKRIIEFCLLMEWESLYDLSLFHNVLHNAESSS